MPVSFRHRRSRQVSSAMTKSASSANAHNLWTPSGLLCCIPSFPRLGSIWALVQQQVVATLVVEDTKLVAWGDACDALCVTFEYVAVLVGAAPSQLSSVL